MTSKNLNSVSAVIISYNAVNTIRSCLDSCLNQTVSFSEIVAVDCGSTDGTLDYLAGCENIRVVNSPKGFSRQRNAGAKACSSDYVFFL